MLVLSCKEGESILIGDDIEIEILVSKNGSTRVGVKAPKEVAVDRKEVRVLKERDAAALEQ